MSERARTAADDGVMVGFPPPPERRVTLANWQMAPFNRWSFQHVSEVLRTSHVPRGPDVWELSPGPADLGRVRFETEDGTATELREWLSASFTDGVIVLHEGQVVFEHYQNGMRSDSLHLSMSVAKSMTSLLVGVLVERGLIDVTALATIYAPELAGSGYEGATVQHLLDMAVALDYVEDYVDPAAEFWKIDVACAFGPDREGAPAHSLIELWPLMRGVDRPHGEVFQYCSPNTDLLGLICSRVTGTGFAELFSREVWAPLGAEHDANVAVDPAGTAVVDGGFNVSLRDFARIGQLVLEEGSANGRQVVPAEWVRELWRPNREPFNRSAKEETLPGGSYHNQWWSFDGRLNAWGIHGQFISIDREARTVVVRVSSEPDPNLDPSSKAWRNAIAAIVDAVLTPSD